MPARGRLRVVLVVAGCSNSKQEPPDPPGDPRITASEPFTSSTARDFIDRLSSVGIAVYDAGPVLVAKPVEPVSPFHLTREQATNAAFIGRRRRRAARRAHARPATAVADDSARGRRRPRLGTTRTIRARSTSDELRST